MKKVLLLLMSLVLTFGVFAQTTQKVTVNKSDLTPDQLAKIESKVQMDEMKDKVEQYGEWVGIGGEVGVAIKEGLSAVVDVADKFGSTKVGEFTMLMVGWKVMGKDLIKIILGLLFITIFSILTFKFYKDTFYIKKFKVKDPGLFKYPKEYKIIEPKLDDDIHWLKLCFLVGYFLAIWITYAIMF